MSSQLQISIKNTKHVPPAPDDVIQQRETQFKKKHADQRDYPHSKCDCRAATNAYVDKFARQLPRMT